METEFFQDGSQIKREKDICHHGPKHIPIICQFPHSPSFSLPPTFKKSENRNKIIQEIIELRQVDFCSSSWGDILLNRNKKIARTPDYHPGSHEPISRPQHSNGPTILLRE
jgi:hypothetical protein